MWEIFYENVFNFSNRIGKYNLDWLLDVKIIYYFYVVF